MLLKSTIKYNKNKEFTLHIEYFKFRCQLADMCKYDPNSGKSDTPYWMILMTYTGHPDRSNLKSKT